MECRDKGSGGGGCGGLVLVLVLWQGFRPPPGQAAHSGNDEAQGPHIRHPASPCPYTIPSKQKNEPYPSPGYPLRAIQNSLKLYSLRMSRWGFSHVPQDEDKHEAPHRSPRPPLVPTPPFLALPQFLDFQNEEDVASGLDVSGGAADD